MKPPPSIVSPTGEPSTVRWILTAPSSVATAKREPSCENASAVGGRSAGGIRDTVRRVIASNTTTSPFSATRANWAPVGEVAAACASERPRSAWNGRTNLRSPARSQTTTSPLNPLVKTVAPSLLSAAPQSQPANPTSVLRTDPSSTFQLMTE